MRFTRAGVSGWLPLRPSYSSWSLWFVHFILTAAWPQSACSTSSSILLELCVPSETKPSLAPIYTTRTIMHSTVLPRRPSMLPSPSFPMHPWYEISLFSWHTFDSVICSSLVWNKNRYIIILPAVLFLGDIGWYDSLLLWLNSHGRSRISSRDRSCV
jgi:hypothetical protein